jgi:hypothetical protein
LDEPYAWKLRGEAPEGWTLSFTSRITRIVQKPLGCVSAVSQLTAFCSINTVGGGHHHCAHVPLPRTFQPAAASASLHDGIGATAGGPQADADEECDSEGHPVAKLALAIAELLSYPRRFVMAADSRCG